MVSIVKYCCYSFGLQGCQLISTNSHIRNRVSPGKCCVARRHSGHGLVWKELHRQSATHAARIRFPEFVHLKKGISVCSCREVFDVETL